MSLHFASWFPFWGMFKLFVKEKNAQFALLPKTQINSKHIRPIPHWPHLAQDDMVERVDTGLLAWSYTAYLASVVLFPFP